MKGAFLLILVQCALVATVYGKGGWSSWSNWSSWGKGLCSGNQRVKTRTCTNPLPKSGNDFCEGENAEVQSGSINGGLSAWSQWSSCEKPCGGSVVNRTRSCNNPPPKNGGSQCSGSTFETKLECVMPCPEGRTDGAWSPWSAWTNCPKSCTKNGGVLIKRYRQCNMPPPMFGGADCPGESLEETYGCFHICPVDGGFSQWTAFTPCSKSCGSGVMSRYRLCNDPEPRGASAKNCTGDFSEVNHCKLETCIGEIDGGWGSWGAFGECSESKVCLQGVRKRTRPCNNPTPNKGGDVCAGQAEEVEKCPKVNCKENRPTPPPTLPVRPGDYIDRECGAKLKSIGSKIPVALLNVIGFQKNKFQNGYFAEREEENSKVKKYCFEPWPPLTVKEVAEKLKTYNKSKELPNFKKPGDSVPTLGLSVRVVNDATNKLKGWDLGLTETHEYSPGNNVKLEDVMFTYYSEGSHWGFLAKGKYTFFKSTVFDTLVLHNRSSAVTSMTGTTKSMKPRMLLDALGLPKDIAGYGEGAITALKNLGIWDIEFSPASVGYDFKAPMKSAFRLTASKRFGRVPLHFEAVFVQSGWDPKIAFGFQFDGESFGGLLEQMSNSGSVGVAVSGFLNKLGLQVEVGVAYCPSYFGSIAVSPASTFQKQPLNDIFSSTIPDGLHAAAQLSIPKDCGDSSFCTIMKKVIGPSAKFRIAGTVRSGYYKVSAGFYKIRIYKEYYFNKLELYCEVNTTDSKRTLGFLAEVQVPVNQGQIMVDGFPYPNALKFGGKLTHEIGSTAVTGSLYMNGIWYKAFGLKWLNFGNIHLGITLDAKSPVVVSGFQFGATVDFGNDCFYDADYENDGHCLRFKAYFAVGKPAYFYGSVSALTVSKIVRMVGGNGNLPKPVASSGFPKGLMVSFNAGKAEDLRVSGGPYIPDGFMLRGTLDLFSYQIRVDIKFSEKEIKLDGELGPINLGGHVIMSRNASHKSVGPKLFFHYRQAPKGFLSIPYFKMYFEGYLKVLGIEASAYLNITMEQMEVYIYGKVWNLVYAELYVAAGYSTKAITNAHFYIRVIVDLRGLTQAIENARKAVDKAFKKAQEHIRGAIDHVKQKKRECKEKLKLKCNNCYALKCKQAQENCKGFLDKAGKWIGGVINKAGRWIANTVRKVGDGLAKVGNAIKNFFKGWRRRRALLEQRDANFDVHVRNKRFISKFICEGVVGGGCRGISHLCYGTCKAVDYIGQGLCHTLDIAVAALKVAEVATGWINSAIQFLMQMFLVHGIRFELGLGQKFNGFMVAAEIDLTIFGNRMNFGFNFDLKNPVRSITGASDSSLYRYKQGVRQLRTELTYNPFDQPNPFSDFDLAGTFGIEALQTGTENRLGGCVAALTKSSESKLVLLACNSTDERQRWTYNLKGSLINMYSKKCLYMEGTEKSLVKQVDCESKKKNQEHECDVAARTWKLRRHDLCVSIGKTSNTGPGSIAHHGSLKCFYVSAQNTLIIRNGCHRVDSEFNINKDGHLVFVPRNLCAKPMGGNAKEGARLQFVQYSSNCPKFSFTKLGSLQHVDSGLCIQAPNMAMKPHDYTEMVLGKRCEFITDKQFGDADPQLTFAFLPQDNILRLKKCGSYYDLMMEQRFAVMNEELNSVCSKHAVDIALQKVASQSSVQYNGFPSRAVDGNMNFQWEKGSCTHTKEEHDPWWRVDLGKEYIITDVTIINRGEHGERLKNIQVHVGPDIIVRNNPVCHDRVRQAQDGEAIRLQCDPPIPGQYVGVQMYGKGTLSMCEVIVASRLGGLADWCRIENGGCEQLCYNQCGRKTSCGCLPGYRLAYDRRTCMDIDECLSNNGGCRTDKYAHCINYPGGYYCGCEKGYILKDNSLTECVDFNECGSGNGGCEQMCNNTLGGYMCTCRQGYERKPNNPYGCQNVNECLNKNGGCDHICRDYDGGHFCSCKLGFRLRDDRKTCEELYCSVLEAPYYGHVSPVKCAKRFENIPVATVCKFECSKGYEVKTKVGKSELTCRIDGTWDHSTPSCHPVKCPTLPRPVNGGLVPARCHDDRRGFNEFGQRCVAYCKHGYRMRGAITKYCQADQSWSNATSPVECVKIVEPPYLNCPTDPSATLPIHSKWMTLGTVFLEPETNLNKSKIDKYPKDVGPEYKFSFGKTLVAYYATGQNGEFVSCSYFVHIRDETPPVVTNCPSNITITTDRPNEIISWKEPTFTDNVAVRKVLKPIRKSGEIWTAGESNTLLYLATDVAGNQMRCQFTVTLKLSVCPPLKSDKTDVIVRTIRANYLYAVTCRNHSYMLFGNYGTRGAQMRCRGGQYFIDSQSVGYRVPDCVGYRSSYQYVDCGEGYQKLYEDGFFGGKNFYCGACPTGYHWENDTRACQECVRGEYQDEQGRITCELCPLGKSTKEMGSKSITDCLDECPRGTYSTSGLDEPGKKCVPCPQGSFADSTKSTVCQVCPGITTTKTIGAQSEEECYDESTRITDIKPSGTIRTIRNSKLVIDCYFSAVPIPVATWTKDGGDLPKGAQVEDIYDYSLKYVGISIRFASVSSADTGSYTCSVVNSAGSDSKHVTVQVK